MLNISSNLNKPQGLVDCPEFSQGSIYFSSRYYMVTDQETPDRKTYVVITFPSIVLLFGVGVLCAIIIVY